jgi:Protein of unknown function (DUF3311)
MSEPSGTPGQSPVVTPTRVIAGVCLVIPFVAMLWVGSYAKPTPEFIGVPFFYWYQMLWVFLSSGLTYVAYILVRREEQARKEAAK